MPQEKTTSLIRLPEVRQRTGLSRSAIYALMREGRFPAQTKIGLRCSAWSADEISEWVSERLTEQLRRDMRDFNFAIIAKLDRLAELIKEQNNVDPI